MKSVLLLLSLFITPAFAKEPLKGCLSEYETQTVNRRIKIRVGQDWDTCNPQNRYYQLVESLTLMQKLEWNDQAAPRPYNQEILGYEWFKLFTSRVRNIAWGEAQDPATCSGAAAYAHPGTKNIATCIAFYSNEEKSNYAGYVNVVTATEMLMHEARHLMGNYNHTGCNGVSQGCDKSVGFKGAYAASMEVYVKLGLTASNLHPAQSSFARRMAYVTAVDKFVKRPIAELPAGTRIPTFRSIDNKFLSLTGEYTVHSFFTGVKPGRIIRWLGGMFQNYLLLPDDGSTPELVDAYKWYPHSEVDTFNEDETPVSGIDGFLNSPTIKRLKDDRNFSVKGGVIVGGGLTDNHLGWIVGEKIVLERGDIPRNSRTFEYFGQQEFSLPNGELPIAIRNGAVSEKTDTGYIYVLSDKDRLYKFSAEYDYASRPDKFLGYKMTEETNPYPGYTHAYGLDEIIYLLDKEGRAYRVREGGKPALVPGLESYRFSTIEFHWYYAKDVPPELEKRP